MDDFQVMLECKSPRRWRVEGEGILRFARMTNWDYYEAALRFQKVLEASGGPQGAVDHCWGAQHWPLGLLCLRQ